MGGLEDYVLAQGFATPQGQWEIVPKRHIEIRFSKKEPHMARICGAHAGNIDRCRCRRAEHADNIHQCSCTISWVAFDNASLRIPMRAIKTYEEGVQQAQEIVAEAQRTGNWDEFQFMVE